MWKEVNGLKEREREEEEEEEERRANLEKK